MIAHSSDMFDTFLKFHYPELKSYAISYLTLVTSVLVFSITFAEKVIAKNATEKKYDWFLFLSWFSFLFSIIACGYGLRRLFAAADIASDWYAFLNAPSPAAPSAEPLPEKVDWFKQVYGIAYDCLNYSGFLFVIGIGALIISGFFRVIKGKPRSA